MVRRSTSATREIKRKKRPGVHSKTKTSKVKNSKNYKKRYNRQGR